MQKIRIDFDNPGLPQHISAVENDSQSRFFQATLYENGKAYTAPEGAAYSIMYRGFGPQNQGWYDTINDGAGKRAACAVSGNVVTCEIARQALQVPGHVSIVLCVTTGKGYMLKSWPIECDCKNDRYDSTVEIQSFFYVTQISNESWTQAIQAVEELKNTIDPTLSLSGKAADAAKVGEAVNAEATRAKGVENQLKKDKVNKPEESDNNKIARAKNGDVEWVDMGQPTDEQTASAVTKWLDNHPEATTTVQNGAIGEQKIEESFLLWIKKDYVTPEMFGAVGDGVEDDTEAIRNAIQSGRKVVLIKEYNCSGLSLPQNCEIVVEGKLNLNGTINISNPKITIKGNGTIKVNSQIGFLLYGTKSNACRDIRFKDVKLTGNQKNTCVAITNTNEDGYVVYVHIDCDIVNFMYGVHSYSVYSNNSWFTSISINGIIENCNRAVHFEWGGTGSYIKSIIQPCVNIPKSDTAPLILIGSNCILDCMIWDIDSANNKKAIKITGLHNKINCPIENKYIEIDGVQAEAIGYVTPYVHNVFKNVSSAYSHGGKTFPLEMAYDNSNDISLMAGNNTINLEVAPKEQTNNAKEMLSGTRTEWFIDGKNHPEITLTFDFPKPVALRECFVAGEYMPQSVKFEYKNENKEYVELKTCQKNIDYVSGSGSNNYAFWQFSYGKPENFIKKFAYGAKITIKSDDTYRITRIYMGVTDILFVNKNGDDITANTLLLKKGNDYYKLTVNEDGTILASKTD